MPLFKPLRAKLKRKSEENKIQKRKTGDTTPHAFLDTEPMLGIRISSKGLKVQRFYIKRIPIVIIPHKSAPEKEIGVERVEKRK